MKIHLHQGDLPNLVIGTDGRGAVGITIPGATMAGLLDADGSALVVHANQDDLMTDPSGNSGARLSELTASTARLPLAIADAAAASGMK